MTVVWGVHAPGRRTVQARAGVMCPLIYVRVSICKIILLISILFLNRPVLNEYTRPDRISLDIFFLTKLPSLCTDHLLTMKILPLLSETHAIFDRYDFL